MMPVLSAIEREQSQATKRSMENTIQLLDYLATHPDAKVGFYTSAMILNIHSGPSYLSEPQAIRKLAGYVFLGNVL